MALVESSTRIPDLFLFFFSGELPISIIKMKTQGVRVSLYGNSGITLPSNLNELGDIKILDLSGCSLTGLSIFIHFSGMVGAD